MSSSTAVTAEHEANLRPLMLNSLPQRHVNRMNFSKYYKYVNKSVVMTIRWVTKFPHSFAIGIGSIKYSSAGESSGVRCAARERRAASAVSGRRGGGAASSRRSGCVLVALRYPRGRAALSTSVLRSWRLRSPASLSDERTEHYQYL